MKFLLVLFLLFAGIMLAANYSLKKIRRMLTNLTNPGQHGTPGPSSDEVGGEVLYRSDEMTVLKGEAGRKSAGEE